MTRREIRGEEEVLYFFFRSALSAYDSNVVEKAIALIREDRRVTLYAIIRSISAILETARVRARGLSIVTV